ncbi:MAG: hypothetical protein WBV45_08695, partial [Lutimonas sp.]
MSNAGTYPFIRTFELLADTFLKPKETLLSSNGGGEKTLSLERIQACKGQYFTPDISGDRRADLEVYVRDNQLYLQLSEEDAHQLTWIEEDLFRYDSPQLKFPVEVRFYRDDQGRVRYLNHYWRTSVKIER